MKTIDHKEALASHPAASVSLNSNVTSIDQSVTDASRQTAGTSTDPTSPGSHNLVAPAIDNVLAELQSKMDHPNSGNDPSLHGDQLLAGTMSEQQLADLIAQSGIPGDEFSSPSSSPSQSNAGHTWLGSMLSDEVSNAGTAPVPVGYNDEGVHAAKSGTGSSNADLNRIGNQLGTGGFNGPTRDAMQQALKEDDSNSGRTSSGGGGSNTNSGSNSTDHHKPDNGITTSTSSNGSKTVTDLNNHTATTVNKDGSTETWKVDDNGVKQGDKPVDTTPPLQKGDHNSGTSFPSDDPDNAGRPHAPIQELLRMAEQEHIGPDRHHGDNVNVTNSDIPGAVSQADLHGVKIDGQHTSIGGDTSFEGSQQGGHLDGTPATNYNGSAGAIDYGPDHDGMPQTNGPTPKDTHQPIATNPAGRAENPSGGHQGSDGGHSDSQHFAPPLQAETNALQIGAELVKAVGVSHSDGHSTAQSVETRSSGQDIASVLGSAPGGHDNDHLAELIHSANNPASFGMPAEAPAHGPEVSSTLGGLVIRMISRFTCQL